MVLAGMVRICGYEARECSSPDEAIAALASGHEGTVALIASRAGPLSAVECYESLVRSSPGLKFLIIAAADGAELAIKAMRLPSDIVLKRPFSVQRLSARLAEAFNPPGSA
jgi:DNA-binding NtrC family response regulator